MAIWLTLLLLAGIQNLVLSCSPHLSHNCEGYEEMTEARIIFPDSDNIDSECARYDDLFECVIEYQSDCSFKQRVIWQSIHLQLQQLCSYSREAYVFNGYCWSDDLNSDLDYCNMEMRGDLETMEPCSAIDKYIECCRESTEELCDKSSSLVTKDLATAYVSIISSHFKCSTNSTVTASTTSTLPTTTSTTTLTTVKTTTDSPKTSTKAEDDDATKNNAKRASMTSTPDYYLTEQLNDVDEEEEEDWNPDQTRPLTAGSTGLTARLLLTCVLPLAFRLV